MIKPDEPFVGTNLLAVQASEVQMQAHHTTLSTGFYTGFQIFVAGNSEAAFLLRKTEDRNYSEFMDFKILASYGSDLIQLKNEFVASDDRTLVNSFNQFEDNDADAKCGKCKEQFNLSAKISQKKTGYMYCPEPSDDLLYFCN
jgi:hypothetical protein